MTTIPSSVRFIFALESISAFGDVEGSLLVICWTIPTRSWLDWNECGCLFGRTVLDR